MGNDRDAAQDKTEIDELIENSSLGSAAARSLRARTDLGEVAYRLEALRARRVKEARKSPQRHDTWPFGDEEDEQARSGLLTTAQAAVILGVSQKAVTRWAKIGMLSSIRTLGGHRRFRETEVREMAGREADTEHRHP